MLVLVMCNAIAHTVLEFGTAFFRFAVPPHSTALVGFSVGLQA